MKNLFLSFLLFIASTTISFGQEKTMEDRANQEVEKINTNIIAANPSSALSKEQKEKILGIFMEKFKSMSSLSKSGKTEEEINQGKKEINLKCNQTIFREVFTPEQKIANKEGREKNKK